MIATPSSWFMAATRPGPCRARRLAQPVADALETRRVLSNSISTNIGGLIQPVLSLTIPAPAAGSEAQDLSMVVNISHNDQKLFKDAETGKVLRNVSITLNSGKHAKDTITLVDAVIASYQLSPTPSGDKPTVTLTLDGQTRHTGSMSATLDGVSIPLLSLTIPQAADSSGRGISLVAKLSAATRNLLVDADTGKLLPAVQLTLDDIGNGLTETISLANVLISSVQFEGGTSTPAVEINLA
jgi:type VI protein secretion system component Hcp